MTEKQKNAPPLGVLPGGPFQELLDGVGDPAPTNCTSIPSLNRRIPRLQGITIIGGDPKVGKSTLAQQIALDYARTRTPVLYLDFEMGYHRMLKRWLEADTGLQYDIEAGKRDPSDLRKKMTEFQDANAIAFAYFWRQGRKKGNCLSPNKNPDPLVQTVAWLRNQTGADPVIFVDSLQKLPFLATDRRTSIDMWLRYFEGVAEDAPVVAVSELSREGKYKESGDIEYSADNCLQLRKTSDGRSFSLLLDFSRDYESGPVCRLIRKGWRFVEIYEGEEIEEV